MEDAFGPGVRTAEYARCTGVDQSLLYRWRRQFFGQRARLPAFTPVAVMPDAASGAAPAAPSGMLEVEFTNGARLRITGTVNPALVTTMLAAFAG